MDRLRRACRDLAQVTLAAGLWLMAASATHGQSRTEPGLETAVKWKWRAAPSDPLSWISPMPDPTPEPVAEATPVPEQPSETYEVKRGDAIVIIARKYGLSPVHIKTFNGLTSDLIRVGQVLNIPSRTQALAIAPLPEPPRKKTPQKPGQKKPGVSDDELRTAIMQTFLDRQFFSSGPIDGKRSAAFEKVLHLYRLGHPEINDPARLSEIIRSQLGEGFTTYVLRPQDFRYIVPPKAGKVDPAASPAAATATAAAAKESSPKPTYDDLVSANLLLYRTPWEFVAERFHCDESFLRELNAHLQSAPMVGTELRVPNVTPFEIERFLREPVQGLPNPQIKAAIIDHSMLQIFQGNDLIAVMPVSMARPGLRGKDTWTILNAIALPRLGTFQELREQVVRPRPPFGQQEPEKEPPKPVILAKEQFLAQGPNNPVGLVWINLAKSGSTEPLPFGLHGVSNPDNMETYFGLGGIQMANWNIVRAARLLGPGTPLEWKQAGLGVAPAAVPAAALP